MKGYIGAFLALWLCFLPHASPVPNGHVNTTTRRTEFSGVDDTDSSSETSGTARVSLTVLRNVLQFLSGCIKREWQLRRAIRLNQNAVICPYTKIWVRRPIDITGKTFQVSCRPDFCGWGECPPVYDCSISGKGKRGLFKGTPLSAAFNNIDFGNGTSQNGGAFELTGGSTTFSDCSFQNNTAKNNGGAISITGGTVVFLTYTRFTFNTAFGNGGAISASGLATMEVNAFFYTNSATRGDAISVVNGASASLNQVEVNSEASDTNGTSIFVQGGKVTLNGPAYARKGSIYIADDGDPAGAGSFVSCPARSAVCFSLVEFAGGMDGSQAFNNTNCTYNQTGSCW